MLQLEGKNLWVWWKKIREDCYTRKSGWIITLSRLSSFPGGKITHPSCSPLWVERWWFYVFLRKEPIIERGEKIGNFFSAKYTIRYELGIYKVGFPILLKERLWGIRSGCSWKKSDRSNSLFFTSQSHVRTSAHKNLAICSKNRWANS